MKLLTNIRNRIMWLFYQVAGRVLMKLDNDAKRMCLLTIIHAKWVGGSDVSDRFEKAKVLNEQLGLVKDPSALKFLVCTADKCFKGVPTYEAAAKREDCGWNRIRRAIPCWIRYADDATLRADIQRVFALSAATPFAV